MDVEGDTPMDSNEVEMAGDEEEEDENVQEEEVPAAKRKVYLPGQPMQSDEELECDETAYVFLHQAKTGSPCLSFDIVSDSLGADRPFPLTSYLVAGTQGERKNANHLISIKMSNLRKTLKEEKKEKSDDDDEDSDSDSEAEADELPRLDCTMMPHKGCINRVRSAWLGDKVVAATWSELGQVHVWDMTGSLRKLEALGPQDPVLTERIGLKDQPKPIYTFSGHQTEGFAMDWCQTTKGMLATGDCAKNIHIWTPKENATGWIVDQRPLTGHEKSVEDVQWSPSERNVLASCSVDCSIKIWDTRAAPSKACKLTVTKAHDGDVNVINWNRNEAMIVSGGDDGKVKVWDLRQLKEAVATFKHHSAPVTTVEWHPSEGSVFASGGADDQIAIWDLAVERDGPEEETAHLPPQLLFIHQGQKDIKELHWHPQVSGMIISTALSGFNIFKTISV
ncbi:glutamate-rich WD repeat-containing protein 1 [Neocloeon triangulifer]|uniref:glutamate-rich WD repeat-containing protein 1 n=1 Tax=Neocloeon triangulifer TaxID=2078957 RepID=UPI00286F6EB2|nr:glutamate-rich WD repeat-containing protein 1 [Neocloeon triangulifer]